MSGLRKISPPVRSAHVMFGFSRTIAITSSVVSSSAGLRCQMLQVLHLYWHQYVRQKFNLSGAEGRLAVA